MATPAQILNIGAAGGKNHFNVGIGTGSMVDHSQSEIEGGFILDPNFKLNAAGNAVNFQTRCDAATTSGSNYPRSELREMRQDGTTKADWTAGSGTHRLHGRTRMTHLTPVKPSLCFTQLHDTQSDAIQLQTTLVSGSLRVAIRINGSTSGLPNFPYTVGDELEWLLDLTNGGLKIFINNMTVPVVTSSAFSSAGAGYYWKTGAYLQSNETIDSASEYMSCELRDFWHWHDGWPAVQVIGGGATAPTVSVGLDATLTLGTTFNRTATETGGTIATREWIIASGPVGVGTTLGGSATLAFTPSMVGTYVLRYTGANATGTSADDLTLTVTAVPVGGGGGTGPPPSFIGNGAAATGLASGISIPPVPGVVVGDFQVAYIISAGMESMTAVPPGWQLLKGATGTSPSGAPGGDFSAWIYYTTSADAASTPTWSKSGSRYFHAYRSAYHGQTALGASLVTIEPSGTGSTSHATPAVAPVVDSSLVVTAVFADLLNQSAGPWTVPPSGWTSRYGFTAQNSTEYESIAVADKISNAVATSGTWTSTRADEACVFAFVLEGDGATTPPNPGGGDPPPPVGGTLYPSTYPDNTPYAIIGQGTSVVNVSTSAALTTALANASPGQRIVLANGTYNGQFQISGKVGTETSGISIRAATDGGAVFTSGTTFTIKDCAHVSVRGLTFNFDDAGDMFQFRGTSHHCQVYRCIFGPSTWTENALDGDYVYLGDDTHHIRVNHNRIRNKGSASNGIRVYGNFTSYVGCNHIRIDHNEFDTIAPEVGNGKEPIRFGVSSMSRTMSNSVIERNYFTNCLCEPELISVKMGAVRVTGNSVYRCAGGIVIRHGRDSLVADNYILDGVATTASAGLLSGGYRFYDSGHHIEFNYGDGIAGTTFQSAIILDTGDADGASTNYAAHWRVINAVVNRNVLVNSTTAIMVGDNYSLDPTGCAITDNLTANIASGTPPVTYVGTTTLATSTVTGNSYSPSPGGLGLAQDGEGIWRKAGYGPRLTYISAGEVGPGGDLSDTDGTGATLQGSTPGATTRAKAGGVVGSLAGTGYRSRIPAKRGGGAMGGGLSGRKRAGSRWDATVYSWETFAGGLFPGPTTFPGATTFPSAPAGTPPRPPYVSLGTFPGPTTYPGERVYPSAGGVVTPGGIGILSNVKVARGSHAPTVDSTFGVESTVATAKTTAVTVTTTMRTGSPVVGGRAAFRTATSVLKTHSDLFLRVPSQVPPPVDLEIITQPYVPPSRRGLRFIAQSIISGRIVDWDVPLRNVEITYTLSGSTMISAELGPEASDIRDLGLDAWGTLIHAEENGAIRASGIVLPMEIPGESFSVEAAGMAYYPHGMPWQGVLSEIQIDPLEVVRRIWAHLIAQPEGPRNVVVSATTSPVRLGEPGISGTGKIEAAQTILNRIQSGAPYFEDWTWAGCPAIVATWNDALIDEWKKAGSQAEVAWLSEYVTTEKDPADTPAKPYELNWWEAPDCGSEIDSLAKATPFDYVERPEWNATKTDVIQNIDIGYPRLGRRQTGPGSPRFVQGENMVVAAVLRETPDLYASEVIVFGKGEGSLAIRGNVASRNTGRLRRVSVVSDPAGISTQERAIAIGRAELLRRGALLTIGDVVIDATSALAPIGSFQVGDDILVQANIPFHGEVSLWHRIIAYTWAPDTDSIAVQLRRTEQFNYGTGGVAPDAEAQAAAAALAAERAYPDTYPPAY